MGLVFGASAGSVLGAMADSVRKKKEPPEGGSRVDQRLDRPRVSSQRLGDGRDQRVPSSFRRWIRLARASYFVAVDVNASIELGVVSLLASLRARCAFSRHDHSMSCRSSTVKWHGTSLGFAGEVGIDPVCQISANRALH